MCLSNSFEIEKKYIINKLPDNLDGYSYHDIEQGYLSSDPVIRIRRKDSEYILTYKSSGLMVRKEIELPLNKNSFDHLISKIDGIVISKRRYLIPDPSGLTIELDVFNGLLEGFILAEVEFSSEKEANSYVPPEWFGKEVTYDPSFHNVNMSHLDEAGICLFLSKYTYKR